MEKIKTAIALGFFDGVHQGHKKVIKMCAIQKQFGLCPQVITFLEKPSKIINNINPEYIISIEEKQQIIKNLGIEKINLIDIKQIMHLNAKDFIKLILKDKFNAKEIFCGFNFTFAKGGKADAQDLKNICKNYDINVNVIKPVKLGGKVISSSLVRRELESGNIKKVNKLLGHEYSFDFCVEEGKKLGRTIGIPTINQRYGKDFKLPKFGTYASYTLINNRKYYSITNIGVKPTVGSSYPLAETWIPLYNGKDLYKENIKVSLLSFIREEKKFKDLLELKEEILKNANEAKIEFEKYINRGN